MKMYGHMWSRSFSPCSYNSAQSNKSLSTTYFYSSSLPLIWVCKAMQLNPCYEAWAEAVYAIVREWSDNKLLFTYFLLFFPFQQAITKYLGSFYHADGDTNYGTVHLFSLFFPPTAITWEGNEYRVPWVLAC